MRNVLLQQRVRVERMSRALEMLSPLAILERGYALVFDGTGQLVKDVAQVKVGRRFLPGWRGGDSGYGEKAIRDNDKGQ